MEETLNNNLIKAVIENNLRSAIQAITDGADVNAVYNAGLEDWSGWDAVMNDDRFGGRGRSALSFASEKNHKIMVTLLLLLGACEMHPEFGNTALFFAAENGHERIVELLLESMSNDCAHEVGADGVTPLCLASEKGHTAIVKRLLETGADTYVNKSDDEGFTALHGASLYGHEKVVTMLADYGATPDVIDNEGNTPLYLACLHGHTGTAKALVDIAANLEAVDNDDRTPLHVASLHGHTDTVAMLASVGAVVGATDYSGKTPLCMAKEGGHTGVVETLLLLGATEGDSSEAACDNDANEGGQARTSPSLLVSGALRYCHQNSFFQTREQGEKRATTERSLHDKFGKRQKIENLTASEHDMDTQVDGASMFNDSDTNQQSTNSNAL